MLNTICSDGKPAAAHPLYDPAGEPPKKRRRGPLTRVACNTCRLKKLKCSGEDTGCQRCRVNGLDCYYESAPNSGGAFSVTSASPSSSSSYLGSSPSDRDFASCCSPSSKRQRLVHDSSSSSSIHDAADAQSCASFHDPCAYSPLLSGGRSTTTPDGTSPSSLLASANNNTAAEGLFATDSHTFALDPFSSAVFTPPPEMDTIAHLLTTTTTTTTTEPDWSQEPGITIDGSGAAPTYTTDFTHHHHHHHQDPDPTTTTTTTDSPPPPPACASSCLARAIRLHEAANTTLIWAPRGAAPMLHALQTTLEALPPLLSPCCCGAAPLVASLLLATCDVLVRGIEALVRDADSTSSSSSSCSMHDEDVASLLAVRARRLARVLGEMAAGAGAVGVVQTRVLGGLRERVGGALAALGRG